MELETHLIVTCNLEFLDSEEPALVLKVVKDIEKMVNRLISVLRTRKDRSLVHTANPVSRTLYPVSRGMTA
jgi:hypothetical protein